MKKECECGSTMRFLWCWDSPRAGVACNLYVCEECSAVMREDVWDGKGERWLLPPEKVSPGG